MIHVPSAAPIGAAVHTAGRVLGAVCSVTAAILLQRDVSDQGQMIQFVKDLALTGSLTPVVDLGACTLGLDCKRHS